MIDLSDRNGCDLMQHDRTIHLSVAGTRFGPWQVQTCRLSDFYARLSQPVRGQEVRAAYLALSKRDQNRLKDVGGFVGGTLKDSARQNGHITGRDLITLDVDKLESGGTARVLKACEALGCGYLVYSTRKHAPDSPRLRIIIPLASELSADEYEPAARMTAYYLDRSMQMFDRTTFQPVRMMYYPSVCADGEYVYYYADKPMLDGRALLGMFNWQDVASWPRCPDEDAAVRRTASKQQDPVEKEGIVGAFCRVYDVYGAMDKYLPGAYEPVAGSDDRFTFTGGTTSGGAVVYEGGKFLYSHHATDPACDQLCNAFDLVRLHLFAEQDDDVKPGTPVAKLPSWTAMCKLAESDAAVHEQKVSDRAEKIRSDFAPMIRQAGAAASQPAQTAQSNPVLTQTDAAPVTAVPAVQDPVQPTVEDVMHQLSEMLEDGSNKVTSPLVETAMRALGISVARNEISNKLEINGMPEAYSQQEAPNTLPVLISDFLRFNGVNAAPDSVAQYLGAIADKHRYNPVKAWLTSGSWDGCDRWPLVYEILGIDKNEHSRYQTYVRKWFLQSVALGINDFDNPRSAEGALVLQGPQGCGKTLFFRKMATAFRRDLFAEGVSVDLTQKDSVIKATSAWITELGELDSTLKKEQISLKAFITTETDDIRSPYARSSVIRLRRTSFCGTVNPEEFLRDETGSRRFWVVPVNHIDVDGLLAMTPSTIHQIWLQAYYEWFYDRDSYRLSRTERANLERDNVKFEAEVQWQAEIMDLLDLNIPDSERQMVSAAFLAGSVLRGGATAVSVGRALSIISKRFPCVESIRTSKSRMWKMPLRKNLLMVYDGAKNE